MRLAIIRGEPTKSHSSTCNATPNDQPNDVHINYYNQGHMQGRQQVLAEVLEIIEDARVDGMFIEWNGLNMVDIDQVTEAIKLKINELEV